MTSLRFKIESYDALSSTQTLMKERINAGEDVHGLVIQAKGQHEGVGQQGKRWESQRGGSYQTLACRMQDVRKHTGLTLLLALGIVKTLEVYGVQAHIKWPNDIYYRDKKLAGILCERVSTYIVLGVGMNVNNRVPEKAIGLQGWDLDAVHMVVLEGLQVGLRLSVENLLEQFSDVDWLANKIITIAQSGRSYQGLAQGIDRYGALNVLIAQTPRRFVSGTIVEVAQENT